METTATKDSRLSSFLLLFDWQTDFFLRALDGISDTDAQNRLGTKANHVAWLAGSLTEQRFELANTLRGNNTNSRQTIFSKIIKGYRTVLNILLWNNLKPTGTGLLLLRGKLLSMRQQNNLILRSQYPEWK
ncbi:hypothetical protein [Flavobacterium album]|uniref:hypothetical protein n=1 Tax=Flavobacterium album TaxID=2175091 RepID=UPI001C634E37|nr:hypothetical protein [Flavobacterium album]